MYIEHLHELNNLQPCNNENEYWAPRCRVMFWSSDIVICHMDKGGTLMFMINI